jgi:hypothetical protein
MPSRVLRPMSEFDPSEPATLHDRRNDRMIAWSPAFEWEFKRHARSKSPASSYSKVSCLTGGSR